MEGERIPHVFTPTDVLLRSFSDWAQHKTQCGSSNSDLLSHPYPSHLTSRVKQAAPGASGEHCSSLQLPLLLPLCSLYLPWSLFSLLGISWGHHLGIKGTLCDFSISSRISHKTSCLWGTESYPRTPRECTGADKCALNSSVENK